jgi:hypothetical protein
MVHIKPSYSMLSMNRTISVLKINHFWAYSTLHSVKAEHGSGYVADDVTPIPMVYTELIIS